MSNKKMSDGYKWVIVALCFLMVMVALGFTSSTKSLFPDEIAKELNTSVSLVSIGESARYIATAIINIFFGALIARFGAKKLIMAGFLSLISSMLLYSFAENLVVIYIAGALLGIGLAWTTTTMVGYIVGAWCSENKGTIMGAILASNGLGGAIAIQAVGGLINPDVVGSYRAAYRLIAVVLAVVAVVLLIFMRDVPKNASKTPSAGHKGKSRGKDWVGIPISVAAKKWYFWGVLACIFLSGLILQGSHGIVAMHFKAVGVDYSAVKALMSFGSLLLASSKFLCGFVYDRCGLRFAASFCIIIAVASSLMLAAVDSSPVGFGVAVAYTVVSQFALPLETIMLPIYAADLFGERSYSDVLGIFVSVNTAGYAIGAPLMNLSFDIVGSYVPALIIVGIVMAAVFVLLQFVISSAHKEQKRVMRECARENIREVPEEAAKL